MDLTYQNSLPAGLDQWNAQYRLNEDGWIVYPATSLIPLGTIHSGESISVDIQASVEYSAPGTLTDTARVTDGATQLASTTITTHQPAMAGMGSPPIHGTMMELPATLMMRERRSQPTPHQGRANLSKSPSP
jgi:hypothetical protein